MYSAIPKSRLKFNPALDGLRAMGILSIITAHISTGWAFGMAVDSFFVLSGFLITSILLRELARTQTISIRNFYLRRVLRLFPALYVFLAIVYLGTHVLIPVLSWQLPNMALFATLTYWVNWYLMLTHGVKAITHCWTLAIEEQFYLIWPALLLGAAKMHLSRKRVLQIIACGIFASFLIKFFLACMYGADSFTRSYYGTDTRADALLTGCAFAFFPVENITQAQRTVLGWLGTAALVLLVPVANLSRVNILLGGGTLFAFLIATVIFATYVDAMPRLRRLMSIPPLVWIGKLSYSLYLYHAIFTGALGTDGIVALIAKKHGVSAPVIIVLEVAFSFLFAALSYYLVEKWFLKMKINFEENSTSASDEKAGPISRGA